MRIGSYKKHKTRDEEYSSYIPPKLPVDLRLEPLYELMERATHSLSKLDGAAETIPSVNLFLYMYVRKEAVLSSQIEGTQSSLSDLILFENDRKPNVEISDVKEVSRYVDALDHGINRLRSGFPLCLRLIKETHEILLRDTRGKECLPGEFRSSQNWIGGTRPGNAAFVPPEPEILPDYLDNLELYIHSEGSPILIKAAIAHLQFETIHPFLDGNGRIGRLLIILILCDFGLLKSPLLYLSLYFKENRRVYYSLMNEVREKGNWEDWIRFFLKGVIEVSDQAVSIISQITALFEVCEAKIAETGRRRFSARAVFEYLKTAPFATATSVANKLKISVPTARSALNALVELQIIEAEEADQRSKYYKFQKYVNILDAVR
jgi:Fic family protein